ncbi:MAG: chemotaxis protein CheD [Gemmatimonadetes bacterium]|nr:chemotaxis protein CheD [Gemmatimonadota bacterium]
MTHGTSLTVRERVVAMATFAASADLNDRLVTYAVGASLGITVYDPEQRVGGLLHAMLPSSALDAEHARTSPAQFVDTGLQAVFRAVYELGGVKSRLVVKVVGGAWREETSPFGAMQLGERNLVACRALLGRNGVAVASEEVGGTDPARTVMLDIASGDVTVRCGGRQMVI